jgi:DNA-binding CsgD family transcriptional regulator
VAAIERGPASCFLVGDAGIGKTTLWGRAVDLAQAAGYRVLACRPSGSEFHLGFAALGDLLESGLQDVLEALPRPQRRALEVALLLEESTEPLDRRAVGVGFLGALRVLAERGPVLIALDDAQWLDDESARVIGFALRRLHEEPVGALVARRPGAATVLDSEVVASLRMEVGPLSLAALHRVVADRLELSLARPELLKVHRASGGNPFYALELAGSLRDVPAGSGLELPVPKSLHDLVVSRVAALPVPVRRAVLVVALLPDPAVSVVEEVLADRRTPRWLSAAAEAGVVELSLGRVRFTHPLLGAGAYALAAAPERRTLHRRLAGVVTDAEARARHLALGSSRPNAGVAAALDAGADRALARGAPEAAAELWELAVRSTPRGDAENARRRELRAAGAWLRAGDLARYTATLEALLRALPPSDERAEAMVRLAIALPDSERGVELMEAARAEVQHDAAVKAQVQLALSMAWPLRGLLRAEEDARTALLHAEACGRNDLTVQALARISLCRLWAGRSPEASLTRGLALLESPEAFRGYDDPRLIHGLWRMYQGRLDDARSTFQQLEAEAAQSGNVLTVSAFGLRLADVEWRAGRWQSAHEHARRARELAEQIGLEFGGGFALYMDALVGLHLGRLEEARADAVLSRRVSAAGREENGVVMAGALLGFAELSLGNDAEAIGHVRPLLDAADRLQLSLAPHPMGPLALEALVAAGQYDEAEARLGRFEREAAALASPWARLQGLRIRSLLQAAQGDLPSAVDSLAAALVLDPECDWPFERARTLLLRGKTLRRAKQKAAARRSYEEARAIFAGLPAPLWVALAEGELRRLGLRHVPATDLTEGERRVAELAASGLTNRQVATRLFLSPKTVDANLGRVYRKLGIHSRAELGARLGGGEAQSKT